MLYSRQHEKDCFLSYGKQWVDQTDIDAVVSVLKSDFLTQGPAIVQFEKKMCDITNVKYCVAVSSATAGLHISVAALNLEAGKEGITTPNTFVATANCLIYNNLKPVFADINPHTYNISTVEISKKITANTKVIIPVDFAGQPADMKEIFSIAQENNLFIIEDAAHAIGSKYENEIPVGSCRYSDMTVFSFHPVKTITSGEGGAITTNSRELYEKLIMLRSHGITKDHQKLKQDPGPWYYEMQDLGFNYRMSDIQAALAVSQLNRLTFFIKRRREIVNIYNQAFKDVDWITIPYEKNMIESCFHLYILLLDYTKIGKSRKEVMEELKRNKIGTQVHYIPVHTQPYYEREYNYKWGDYPLSENYYKKALSIPLYPKMTDKMVSMVIENILNLI